MFQNETGRLQLEGRVCDDYYRVRELLYEQFAIVWVGAYSCQPVYWQFTPCCRTIAAVLGSQNAHQCKKQIGLYVELHNSMAYGALSSILSGICHCKWFSFFILQWL